MYKYFFYLTYCVLRNIIGIKVNNKKLEGLKLSYMYSENYIIDLTLFVIVLFVCLVFSIMKIFGFISSSWFFLLIPIIVWLLVGVVVDNFFGGN